MSGLHKYDKDLEIANGKTTDTIDIQSQQDSLKNKDIFSIRDDSVYTKQIDSLQTDTLSFDTTRKKTNTIDKPVKYSSRDSMTYDATEKKINLFGNSEVL